MLCIEGNLKTLYEANCYFKHRISSASRTLNWISFSSHITAATKRNASFSHILQTMLYEMKTANLKIFDIFLSQLLWILTSKTTNNKHQFYAGQFKKNLYKKRMKQQIHKMDLFLFLNCTAENSSFLSVAVSRHPDSDPLQLSDTS